MIPLSMCGVVVILVLASSACPAQDHQGFADQRVRPIEERSAEQWPDRFDSIGRMPDDDWLGTVPRTPMAERAVREAARDGQSDALRKILDRMPHAARDPVALANAIDSGCGVCVTLLLSQGADPERALPGRLRPLAQAIDLGRDDIALALIEAGASVHVRAHDLTTPLIDAVRFNRATVALRLIEAGADKEQIDREGRPPVVLAAELGHLDVLETLLRSGADPDALDKDGRPALYWAVYRKRRDAIRMLLSYGAQRGTIAVDLY